MWTVKTMRREYASHSSGGERAAGPRNGGDLGLVIDSGGGADRATKLRDLVWIPDEEKVRTLFRSLTTADTFMWKILNTFDERRYYRYLDLRIATTLVD